MKWVKNREGFEDRVEGLYVGGGIFGEILFIGLDGIDIFSIIGFFLDDFGVFLVFFSMWFRVGWGGVGIYYLG